MTKHIKVYLRENQSNTTWVQGYGTYRYEDNNLILEIDPSAGKMSEPVALFSIPREMVAFIQVTPYEA